MAPTLVNLLVRLLLSPGCAACGSQLDQPLEAPVCAACWRAIVRVTPPFCMTCGAAIMATASPVCGRCTDETPSFSMARSVAAYEGSMREIVHAFKYGRRRPLAIPLARLMLDAGRHLLEDADAVIPVPLHPWRSLHRGFNQADDLAAELSRPVWRVLRRRRHGRPQAASTRAARRSGVRDAFCLARTVSMGVAGRRLRGATVVLIDDVMTTGATLDACGRVLLDAGVSDVRALTVARVLEARPSRPPMPQPPSSARRR